MSKGLPLRDRRRRQTAREIHATTLRLAGQHGFEAVTTEMIALGAGISTRTFFNYFPNKEAAAIGETVELRDRAIEEFALGRGSLLADLRTLLCDYFHDLDGERERMRALIRLARTTPRLAPVFLDPMRVLYERLFEGMVARFPDQELRVLELLAEVTVACIRRSAHAWAESDAMTIGEAVEEVLDGLSVVAGLLAVGER